MRVVWRWSGGERILLLRFDGDDSGYCENYGIAGAV